MPPRIGLGLKFLLWEREAVLVNSLREVLPDILDRLAMIISLKKRYKDFSLGVEHRWCQLAQLQQGQ